MSLRFNMLLADEDIKPSEVRLIRHQTAKVNKQTPYSLWRDNPAAFECYQSMQKPETRQRARLNGRYWASFVAPPSGGTLFVGLFEVTLNGSVPDGTIDPFTGALGDTNADQYDCKRLDALSSYIGCLSVYWGATASASRAWVQRADKQDKPIIELTKSFQEESFPGFTKLSRPLSELETMPFSWKEALRSARGVYLLACPRTREHYVGSASGVGGFLGRWQQYAGNGHGGNVGLQNRPASDYLVSVLEVVGSSSTIEDILSLESMWKSKLHSRYIGLNLNG